MTFARVKNNSQGMLAQHLAEGKRKAKKRTKQPVDELLREPHLLSEDALIYLSMAYVQWLPAVAERPIRKKAKRGSRKRAKRKIAA